MNEAYHTALRPDAVEAREVRRWEGDGNRAFVHDIANGLPMMMYACDVLYTDLPWADGYHEFNRRAGVINAIPYEAWLYRVSGAFVASGKPWVASGGAGALRGLACEWVTRFNLNGSTAVLMGAGLPRIETTDQFAVLRHLARRYECVGDPCCGFGRTARIFAEAGKKFTVSDVNAKCIGYIADQAPGWIRHAR